MVNIVHAIRQSLPLFACLLAAIAGLVSGAGAFAQDWPTWQHDNARTGFSDIDFDPNQLKYAWKTDTSYSNPIVVGGSLFARRGSMVSAFSLNDGTLLWQKEYDGSDLTYAEGSLWYTSYTEGVFCIDPQTGLVQSHIALRYLSSPIPLVIGEGDGSATLFTSANELISVGRESINGPLKKLWEISPAYFLPTFSNLIQAGDSVIIRQPGQNYAIDTTTGNDNHFFITGFGGGGSPQAVYDDSRNQLYITELDPEFGLGVTTVLRAYEHHGYDDIREVWELPGGYRGIAIDGDGLIYAQNGSVIDKINPVNGQIIDSVTGNFATTMTPTIIGDVLIAHSDGPYSGGAVDETYFYDIHSFELLKTIPGSRSGGQTATFSTIGYVANGHFVQNTRQGIVVYQVAMNLAGDLDNDGDVDGIDLAVMFANFNGPGGGTPKNPETDLDSDGDVDGVDLAEAFGQFTGPLSPANVPEPSSLVFLSLSSLLLTRRR